MGCLALFRKWKPPHERHPHHTEPPTPQPSAEPQPPQSSPKRQRRYGKIRRKRKIEADRKIENQRTVENDSEVESARTLESQQFVKSERNVESKHQTKNSGKIESEHDVDSALVDHHHGPPALTLSPSTCGGLQVPFDPPHGVENTNAPAEPVPPPATPASLVPLPTGEHCQRPPMDLPGAKQLVTTRASQSPTPSASKGRPPAASQSTSEAPLATTPHDESPSATTPCPETSRTAAPGAQMPPAPGPSSAMPRAAIHPAPIPPAATQQVASPPPVIHTDWIDPAPFRAAAIAIRRAIPPRPTRIIFHRPTTPAAIPLAAAPGAKIRIPPADFQRHRAPASTVPLLAAPNASLPVEVWDVICDHLAADDRHALLNFMRVSSWAYFSAARSLYHTLEIGSCFSRLVDGLLVPHEQGGERRWCKRHEAWCAVDDVPSPSPSQQAPTGRLVLMQSYVRTLLIGDLTDLPGSLVGEITIKIGNPARTHWGDSGDCTMWRTTRSMLFPRVSRVWVTGRGYMSLQDHGAQPWTFISRPYLHPVLKFLAPECNPSNLVVEYASFDQISHHLMTLRHGREAVDAYLKNRDSFRPRTRAVKQVTSAMYGGVTKAGWLANLSCQWPIEELRVYSWVMVMDLSGLSPSISRVTVICRRSGERAHLSREDIAELARKAEDYMRPGSSKLPT